MKAALLFAVAFAANVHGAAIEARQFGRPTSRPGNPGGQIPDGIASPIRARRPQTRAPEFSLGRPTQTVTFFPNDPDDRVEKCGLDAFVGHTSEALLFCSSILKSGTATITTTFTTGVTTTTRTTVITTLYPPSAPSSTARPPSSTPRPPTSTARPPPSSSTPRPSSTRPAPPPSSTTPSPSPTPTSPPANCGIVGYTKSTAAYYFDSSGTKNTFAACSAACKADTKCKSFGYGEANCMLFDVPAADNTNYNPMSPYTFYDAACPAELPVKRQVNISLGLGPPAISSACSCLITSGVAGTTRTATVTASNRVTRTETVTRTVSLLPDSP